MACSTDLPTFGPEIEDTNNIYSWDDKRLLTYREEFVIEQRPEAA